MQNHDLRTLSANKHIRTAGAFLLGALCAFQVSAAVTAPSTAFDQFMWLSTGGAAQSVSYGSGGTPVAVPAPPVIDTDGGLPKVTQTGSIKNPSGNPVSVSLVSRIPVASIVGSIIGGVAAQAVWQAGVALYDLAKERGFTITKDGSGNATVIKTTTTPTLKVQCPFPILGYAANVMIPTTNYTSVMTTCKNAGNTQYGTSVGTFTANTLPTQAAPTTTWQLSYPGYNYFMTLGFGWVSNATVDTSSTLQAYYDDIAAQSGWPAGSKISQALVDSYALNGIKFQATPATLTGPATSTGTTSTTTNPDGTKTVTTNNYTHNYAGNTVTTGATTTVNNYNASNVLTSTTTTTADPVKTPEQQTDCDKYPDSFGCLKPDFDIPTDQIPKTTKNITFAAENLGFAGGSCPANRAVTLHQSGQVVTAGDWTSTCDKVTTYAKPLILLLATFAGLMIIFGGKIET